MGDGLLAMFPYEGAGDLDARCHDALEAAKAAIADLARASNGGPDGAGAVDEAIRCGIALHPGRVLFGNVGSDSRLDFTAIGEAVNMAARLETMAGELGQSILVSAAFAAAEGERYQSLGHFELKGFAGPREVLMPVGV